MIFHSGIRLYFLRKKAKRTQLWLAERLFCSSSLISEWEHGRKEISTKDARSLGEVFQVPSSYFLKQLLDVSLQQQLTKVQDFILDHKFSAAQQILHSLPPSILNFDQEVEVMLLRTILYYYQHLYQQAVQWESSLNLFFPRWEECFLTQRFQQNHLHIKTLHHLFQGNYLEAQLFCQDLLEFKEHISFQLLKAQILMKQNCFEQAYHAIARLPIHENPHLTIHIYSSIMTAATHLSLYQIAEEHSASTKKEALTRASKENFFLYYRDKGLLLGKMKKYQEALNYQEKALSLTFENHGIGPLLISMSMNHLYLQEYLKARFYLALTHEVQLSISEELAVRLLKKQIALFEGELQDEGPLFQEEIDFYQKNGQDDKLRYIYQFLSRFHKKNDNLLQSHYYLEKAMGDI